MVTKRPQSQDDGMLDELCSAADPEVREFFCDSFSAAVPRRVLILPTPNYPRHRLC